MDYSQPSPIVKSKAPRKSRAEGLYASEMLDRLRALGARIKHARIQRKWRQVDVADKTGLSRTAIDAVERGEPTTGIATYFHILWVMGLDKELDLIADPGLDREGLALSYSVTDKRVRIVRKVDNDF